MKQDQVKDAKCSMVARNSGLLKRTSRLFDPQRTLYDTMLSQMSGTNSRFWRGIETTGSALVEYPKTPVRVLGRGTIALGANNDTHQVQGLLVVSWNQVRKNRIGRIPPRQKEVGRLSLHFGRNCRLENNGWDCLEYYVSILALNG